MNNLYTFNSQQFSQIAHQLPKAEKDLATRKIVTSSRNCKKQSLLSHLYECNDIRSSFADIKRYPLRKVMFNCINSSICQFIEDQQLITPKCKPPTRDQLKQNKAIIDSPCPQNRKPATQQPINQCREKRCFSAVQKSDREGFLEQDIKQIIRVKPTSTRTKRISSFKLSPKVNVPISNRKLPEAFKLRMGANSSLPKLVSKANSKLQFLLQQSQMSKQSPIKQKQCKTMIGISRLKNMLELQTRLFEKLYRP